MRINELKIKTQKSAYESGDLEGFKKEFWDSTYQNPFAEFEDVWDDKVAFELKTFKDHVHLGGIRSFEQGVGYGSEGLRWLCNLADKYGVTITLNPQPFGQNVRGAKKKLNLKALKAWYLRYGFIKTGSEYVRVPKSKEQ